MSERTEAHFKCTHLIPRALKEARDEWQAIETKYYMKELPPLVRKRMDALEDIIERADSNAQEVPCGGGVFFNQYCGAHVCQDCGTHYSVHSEVVDGKLVYSLGGEMRGCFCGWNTNRLREDGLSEYEINGEE